MTFTLQEAQSDAAIRSGRRRVLLTTFGSFGDLHPFLAIGLELKARGHEVILCTCSVYRQKIEGEGLAFRPLGPELPSGPEMLRMLKRIMDPHSGTEYIIREVVMPHVRDQYEDLTDAAHGADLMVSHSLTYAAPLVAEKLGIPRVAAILQPMAFCSPHDPPVPPFPPPSWALSLLRLPPVVLRPVFRHIKPDFGGTSGEVDDLRAELDLPPGAHPMFEGQYSPHLNLALFSGVFGAPQPDWPARTEVTGFPFHDREAAGATMTPELLRFLDSGPPPIVFTLGTSAVYVGGDFYGESALAAQQLGRRAVLLVGRDSENRLPVPMPEGVIACEYAPHSELFPHAAALVIQGGIGTVGQALRAGKPTLVVPFAHDQPDNAARLERLGVGRTLAPRSYTARRAASELKRLLENPSCQKRAEAVAAQVRKEDGTASACDALEKLVRSR